MEPILLLTKEQPHSLHLSALEESADITTNTNTIAAHVAADTDTDDTNETITGFSFDDATNILTISEAGNTWPVNFTGTTVTSRSGMTNSTSIRRVSNSKVAITESDYTVILEITVSQLMLPGPTTSNTGQILIIKDLGGSITRLNIPYRDYTNNQVNTTINGGIIWLQSDGTDWQQIN